MTTRRVISRLLVFLSLGLITAVAIAWVTVLLPSALVYPDSWASPQLRDARGLVYHLSDWCSDHYGIDPDIAQYFSYHGPKDYFDQLVRERTAEAQARGAEARAPLPTWGRLPNETDLPRLDVKNSWFQEGRGWPMLALWCEWIDPAGAANSAQPRGGFVFDRQPKIPLPFEAFPRALPCRPIYPGLLADTLFWSLAWTALPLSRAILRRMRRDLREFRGH